VQSRAIIIGAGPAGLATSRELMRAGIEHRVLERGDQLGYTWANLYDSLVLHTGRHLSKLPGLAIPASATLFPSRRDFLDYLHRYAERFRLPVDTGSDVTSVERKSDGWIVHLRNGAVLHTRMLVVATGIVANPFVPDIADRERFGGRVTHSVDYLRPDGMKGRRVLVVGAGNSAGEISVELARAGAEVTVAVHTGARAVPRQLLGIPIQYFAVLVSPLPRSVFDRATAAVGKLSDLVRGPSPFPPPRPPTCPKVPLIGLGLVDAIRAGTIRLQGGLQAFTSNGVRFNGGSEQPFDEVILATGYKPAVGFLDGLIRVDRCGFAVRSDRVTSADQKDLYFVGHNYDTRGGLYNIAQDSRIVGGLIVGF
jgi:cation diffusion facilitator CzcD-associated flavoprotein CzcO